MILDLWFALGGIIGAVIRRAKAKDEANDWHRYAVDCAIAAIGGPLLSWAASWIGVAEDLLATLATNPVRAVAVGVIPAYVGLDLLTMTSERWRGKPTTEAVKELVVAAKPSPAAASEIIAATRASVTVPPPSDR